MSTGTRLRLHVESLALIARATLTLGDLTVFVGPQATGKSLLLQAFKLLLDSAAIQQRFRQYGWAAEDDPRLFAHAYFGEGYADLLSPTTQVSLNGQAVGLATLLHPKARGEEERVFYIPAQRALIFQHVSWPRPFSDFRLGDPFVVRAFSEHIRTYLEAQDVGPEAGVLFPHARRLRACLRDRLASRLLRGTQLTIVREMGQKRLMLEIPGGARLPYLSWSTGQREFIPVLLGSYWLSGRGSHRAVDWIIAEELELGLHPQALADTLLLVLDWLQQGYRVLLSTHSADVLEMVWALSHIRRCAQRDPEQARQGLRLLFDLPPSQGTWLEAIWTKTVYVYYFAPLGHRVAIHDISNLDAWDEDPAVAEWGYLTQFADRATRVVALMAESCGEVLAHGEG
ncbi:MAG: ATP-binding protein [Chloroflexi bacterium]|nr:ATP-binding protein [Chloroflexota bacterium]